MLCPYCPFQAKEADDVTCHLLETHKWSYQRGLAWLREMIEREHCQCEECRYYDAELIH